MDISNIIQVVIARGSKSVSRAGFGVPLIVSSDAVFTDVRPYTSLAGVAVDFATSTQVYKTAAALFLQNAGLQKIKIAAKSATVAQIVTITPTAVNNAIYSVTINGVVYSYTADSTATAAEIVAGLISAITAGSDTTITPSGTTTLVLTAAHAGLGFSYSVGANLAAVLTTANNGLQEDLTAIQIKDNDWYELILTTRDIYAIQNGALWIEGQRKIFNAVQDLSVLNVGTSDVASWAKSKALSRTFFLASGDQANAPEGAWAGQVLPLDPGSETWKFKTLVGNVTDNLSASQEAQALAKNVNIYETVAGVNMTSEGKVAVGEFIDVIRGIDWFQAQLQENLFSLLVNSNKIPFTDKGFSIIEAEIRKQAAIAVRVGLFVDGSFQLFIPKAADISSQDRQARTLSGITFTANLAGAVHFAKINGTVSV